MMFDASAFGVSVVSDKQFAKYDEGKIRYNYAWLYDNKPQTDEEEKKVSDDLMDVLANIVSLENFVPGYLNQSITFTGEDIVGDKAMMEVLSATTVMTADAHKSPAADSLSAAEH